MRTELVFILDKSGSMYGLERDTIGGFNSMLAKQKAEPGEAVVTTVLFDNNYELIHDRFPLQHVGELTECEYFVGGSTAMLDAIGSTIQKISNVQKRLPKELRADKVIFVIVTDGLENSSIEYSYSSVKQLINKHKNKYGWEFMFLGANIDAVSEAAKFGVDEDRAVTYACDSEGVQLNYEVVAETLCAMRHTMEIPVGREWKERIEEDAKRRRGY